LIKQAAEDVRPFVELRGQTLQLDLPDDLGAMDIDALKVRDSINHLLLNAIKFTPDHGRIELEAKRDGEGNRGVATIRVTDTGSGIDNESLKHLFEPFFTG